MSFTSCLWRHRAMSTESPHRRRPFPELQTGPSGLAVAARAAQFAGRAPQPAAGDDEIFGSVSGQVHAGRFAFVGVLLVQKIHAESPDAALIVPPAVFAFFEKGHPFAARLAPSGRDASPQTADAATGAVDLLVLAPSGGGRGPVDHRGGGHPAGLVPAHGADLRAITTGRVGRRGERGGQGELRHRGRGGCRVPRTGQAGPRISQVVPGRGLGRVRPGEATLLEQSTTVAVQEQQVLALLAGHGAGAGPMGMGRGLADSTAGHLQRAAAAGLVRPSGRAPRRGTGRPLGGRGGGGGAGSRRLAPRASTGRGVAGCRGWADRERVHGGRLGGGGGGGERC
ncbi:hypothetical protein VTN02DRAFT_2370 [Thermoascus thermophilus]